MGILKLREITLRPFTDRADLARKTEKVKEFLTRGDRVRVRIRLRGREMSHASTLSLCQVMMDNIAIACSGIPHGRTALLKEARAIAMELTPKK